MANTRSGLQPPSPNKYVAGLTNGTQWVLPVNPILAWVLEDLGYDDDWHWPNPSATASLGAGIFSSFAKSRIFASPMPGMSEIRTQP